MNKDTFRCIEQVKSLGISNDDAWALRRISMQLHRWHELECGTDGGAIERDEKTNKPYWVSQNTRGPKPVRIATPDRETGALKRLDAIINKYQHLSVYVQGDPRGCALYLLRPGDVPQGKEADAYYSRGIPVHA